MLPGNEYRSTWYNRSVFQRGKLTLGFLGAYGLSSNYLVKNNLLMGYQIDKRTAVFCRMENDHYRRH